MSSCLHSHCARTVSKHTDPAHVQASAAASKLLNTALKAQALVIAINRKSQPFPRLTAQDFKELAARAADIKKAETSARIDAGDVQQRKRSWHTLDTETVDDYPARPGHKFKHVTSQETNGSCDVRA